MRRSGSAGKDAPATAPPVEGAAPIEIAKIRLRTLEQQYRLAERLVRGECDVLAKQLDRAQKLREAGFVADAEVERLQNWLQVLREAL